MTRACRPSPDWLRRTVAMLCVAAAGAAAPAAGQDCASPSFAVNNVSNLFTDPPPQALVLGDFHGSLGTVDGVLDAVVARDGVVSLWGGNTVSFPSPLGDFPVGSDPRDIVAADFNRDGLLDIAVANRGSGTVSVLGGTGTGFTAKVDTPVGANPERLVVADFNRDGTLDLVVVRPDGFRILLGVGDLSFAQFDTDRSLAGASSAAAGDFDRDGIVDLVVTQSGFNQVALYLGRGDGFLGKPGAPWTNEAVLTVGVGAEPVDIAVGSLDRQDSYLDFVTADRTGASVTLQRGDGLGGFLPAEPPLVPANAETLTQPIRVAVGDFDRDGVLDVATLDAAAVAPQVLIFPGTGAAGPPPTFDTAKAFSVSFTPSTTPWDFAVGDATLNGRLDLTVAEAGAGTDHHLTLAGNRSGLDCLQTSFGDAPRAYPAGDKPVAVAVADVDEDGIEDLMVAQVGVKELAFLRGNGNGYDAPADPVFPVSPLSSFVRGIATADFDFDGHADFVAALGEPGLGRVQVFLGNGDGTLTLGTNLADGLNFSAVVVGDFDGDGGPDVAATSEETDQLYVFLGRGDGLFDAEPALAVGTSPLALAAGHIDPGTDDFLDLVVANYGSADVSVLTGNGDGSFTTRAPVAGGTGSWSVALGRVDGDPHLDLAVASQATSDVQIFSGDGAGGFAPLVSQSHSPAVPIAVAVLDATDDGTDDVLIVTSSHELHLLRGPYASGFASEETFAVRPRPSQVVAVDADVDGKPDLAIPCKDSHDVVVLLARPPGPPALLTAVAVDVEGRPSGAAAGDFDRDGDEDLAVVNFASDSLTILRNDGNGAFTAEPSITVDVGPKAVIAADFDLDGILDLGLSCFTAGKVVLLKGDGSLGFGSPQTIDVSQTTDLVAGDFDRNGYPDVAAVSKLANTVTVIVTSPLFNFVAGPSAAVGSGPTAIFAADFDRNSDADPTMWGTLDLAVSNGDQVGPNDVTVLYGKDDGTFPVALPLDLHVDDSSPLSITGGDIDNDGDVDVATVAFGGHMLSVFRNSGSGFVATPTRFDASYAPAYVTTGDVNRDGKLDLALAASGLKVLRGQAGLAFEDPENFVAGVDPSAVVIADFNRDGRPDAAVVNEDSDTVSILLSTACVRRRLVVTGSPNACPAGPDPFAIQATVEVQDDGGNQLTCESGNVTATIAPGTGGGGLLGGTTSVPVAAGMADFDSLTIDAAGPRYRLKFDLPGVPAALSRSFSLGPVIEIAGLPSVCPATIEPYSVSPGYDTYSWALDTTPFDHRSATELQYVDLTPGASYTLAVEARIDGCLAADTLDVWVGVLDTVTIDSPGPFSACVDCVSSTFTITNTGGGVPTGYQWGFRTVPVTGGITTFPLETGDTYVFKGTDFPGPGTYHIVAQTTPAAGCGTTVESNEVTVTVTASVPAGDVQSLGARSGGTAGGGESILHWVNSGPLQDVTVRWNVAPDAIATCTWLPHPTDGTPTGGEQVIPYGGSPPTVGQYVDSSAQLDRDYCYSVFARTGSYSSGRLIKARPFDATAGPVKWAYATGATAVAAPVVGQDGIIALSNDRTVHSLDRGSNGGSWPVSWMPSSLTGVAHSRSPIVPFTLPVGGADALFFVGDDEGDVFALDAKTGAPVWGPEQPATTSRVIGAPGGLFTQWGGIADVVVVGTRKQGADEGALHTLNLNTGVRIDTFDGTSQMGAVTGTPVIDYATNRVYVASNSKGGSNPSLWCVEINSGGAMAACSGWSAPNLDDVQTSPVLKNGRLYVSNDTHAFSVDAVSGTPGPGLPISGPVKRFLFPDRRNDDLYFATSDGVRSVTDTAGTLSGNWEWVGGGSLGLNAVLYWPGTDWIYVGAGDGRLYQLDLTGPPSDTCQDALLLPLTSCMYIGLSNGTEHIGAPTLDIGVSPELLLVGSESGVLYGIEVPLP